MREILFRGKSVYNEEWFYGDLLTHEDVTQDSIEIRDYINRRQSPVFRDTVGQYTGFTDENGTKIFEGDIVKCYAGAYRQGIWEHTASVLVDFEDFTSVMEISECEQSEVIGNIHDNPELLEEIE